MTGEPAEIPIAQPPEMTRREVAIGYAWNLLFSVINRIVFPIANLLFYRFLGPEEVGIFFLLVPILTVVETIRDAGLAVTFIADKNVDKEREGGYAALGLITAAIFAGIIFLSRDYIASFYERVDEMRWGLMMVSITMLINGFVTVPANRLQKKGRFKAAGSAEFIASLISLCLAASLIFLGFGYASLVWMFVVKNALYTVFCWILEPTSFQRVPKAVVVNIYKAASANLANNLLYTVYTMADTLMIGALFKEKGAGLYQTPYTLAARPIEFFGGPLSRTLLIAYSRTHDLVRLASIYTKTITVSALAMIPTYVLLERFAGTILTLLVSDKFAGGIPLLRLLAIYMLFRSFGLFSGNVLVAMNRTILGVLGWLIAFAVVGVALALSWQGLTLQQTVLILTVGAITVYTWNTVTAFVVLKPQPHDLRKLAKAVLVSLASSAAIGAISLLPIIDWAGLLLALLLVPPIHMVAIGIVFVRKPFALFSKSGSKDFWKTL